MGLPQLIGGVIFSLGDHKISKQVPLVQLIRVESMFDRFGRSAHNV